jgi:hypothetical protein
MGCAANGIFDDDDDDILFGVSLTPALTVFGDVRNSTPRAKKRKQTSTPTNKKRQIRPRLYHFRNPLSLL